jgi:hypothetical protein
MNRRERKGDFERSFGSVSGFSICVQNFGAYLCYFGVSASPCLEMHFPNHGARRRYNSLLERVEGRSESCHSPRV